MIFLHWPYVEPTIQFVSITLVLDEQSPPRHRLILPCWLIPLVLGVLVRSYATKEQAALFSVDSAAKQEAQDVSLASASLLGENTNAHLCGLRAQQAVLTSDGVSIDLATQSRSKKRATPGLSIAAILYMEGKRIYSVRGNNSQLPLPSAALYQSFSIISLLDKYLCSRSLPKRFLSFTPQPPRKSVLPFFILIS